MLQSLLLGLLKFLLDYWQNRQSSKNDVTVITIIIVKK